MPAHERVITPLGAYDIDVDELFLTGGPEKKGFLDVLKPQIFFDDQLGHLEPAAEGTPCVHIPFGLRNRRQPPTELPIQPAPKRDRKRKTPAKRAPSPRLDLPPVEDAAADA